MFQPTTEIKISIFGESHSEAIGAVLEGLPAGVPLDTEKLKAFAARRKASGGVFSTQRMEDDGIAILSGVKNGRLTGAPVTAVIKNNNVISADYTTFKKLPRPSHADYAAAVKFGGFNDADGGGRFSGRLTAALCAAGGIALQILELYGVSVNAYVSSVYKTDGISYKVSMPKAEELIAIAKKGFPVRADSETEEKMINEIASAKLDGDSVGGEVECVISGMPVGAGGALFDGLEGRLAAMIFGIPAVKGIEFGSGFELSSMRGSEANDEFYCTDGKVETYSNNSGGINGGISNGMPITFAVAFRPTPTISKKQRTIDLTAFKNAEISAVGRHDACIVPRAVPAVEAAAAITLLDALMEQGTIGKIYTEKKGDR